MPVRAPSYRDVWYADLGIPAGHEQGGRRPALVVSADQFNHGPAGLVILVPLTTTARGVALHVPVEPPEGGLRERSFAMCEQVRSLSHDRLIEPWGRADAARGRDAPLLTPAP